MLRVWGLEFGVWVFFGLGLGVWGLGLGAWGLGLRAWGLGLGVGFGAVFGPSMPTVSPSGSTLQLVLWGFRTESSMDCFVGLGGVQGLGFRALKLGSLMSSSGAARATEPEIKCFKRRKPPQTLIPSEGRFGSDGPSE